MTKTDRLKLLATIDRLLVARAEAEIKIELTDPEQPSDSTASLEEVNIACAKAEKLQERLEAIEDGDLVILHFTDDEEIGWIERVSRFPAFGIGDSETGHWGRSYEIDPRCWCHPTRGGAAIGVACEHLEALGIDLAETGEVTALIWDRLAALGIRS